MSDASSAWLDGVRRPLMKRILRWPICESGRVPVRPGPKADARVPATPVPIAQLLRQRVRRRSIPTPSLATSARSARRTPTPISDAWRCAASHNPQSRAGRDWR